ncbi:hypothetical protein GCM10010421_32410 [Streptomyces glaucus]|uniref:Uncharacterized protein n=1 Tax=Streptomyces glaucus TaxID=284029 RepID=A0ABN3JTA2_9ACTN
MRRRRKRGPQDMTPAERQGYNIARILNPPKPSWADRLRKLPWAVEDWWHERVMHRDLYRRFAAAREVLHLLQATELGEQAGDRLSPSPDKRKRL